MTCAIIAFAPYTPWFLIAMNATEGTEWIETWIWKGNVPWLAPLLSLDAFSFGGAYPTDYWHLHTGNLLPGLGCFVAVLLLASAIWLQRSDASAKLRIGLLVLLLGPLVTLWMYSWLKRPIYVPGRYDLISFSAFTVLCGIGLAALYRESRFRKVGLITAGYLCIVATYVIIQMNFKSQEVKVGQYLPRRLDQQSAAYLVDRFPDAVVVCMGYRSISLRYYLRKYSDTEPDIRCFPPYLNEHPGIFHAPRLMKEPSTRMQEASELVNSLQVETGKGRPVVIAFFRGDEQSDQLRDLFFEAMAPHYTGKRMRPDEFMLLEALPRSN